MATYMLARVAERDTRAFFICHRRELVDQTAKAFDAAGLQYSYIANGYTYDPRALVHICSVDTLKNRLDEVNPPSFVVWDEAHHLAAAGWAKVHQRYSAAYHIGLSATPARLDGRGLDDRFDFLVPGPPVRWLIDQGHLAQYKLYSVPGVDLADVRTRMGDFVRSESAVAMDRPTITGDIIRHWRRLAADKLTIGFAVSVQHSEHLCDQFKQAGIMAAHLDATASKDERRMTLRAFAQGDIRVLWNVALFCEGFDAELNSGLPVTVGCVIDAAPTQSLAAWLQRCGRALRPQRQAIIVDHAGNAIRHGMPCEERAWTLAGSKHSKGASSDEPGLTIKQCPACFAVHKPAPRCPECGHVYEVKHRQVFAVDGELQELDLKQMQQRAARRQQGAARSLEALVQLGRQRGYKNPAAWARHVFNARVANGYR